MSRTIYALLVGIDAYQSPVTPLSGCVNDIREVEAFLTSRVGVNGTTVDVQVLTDAQATRPAIKAAFADLLGKAGPEDVALFYYSGHGSQQRTAPELLHLEPDGLDETLVCHDSRSGGWDLSDKELAQLIGALEARGPHIVILLDCCHSGTATRAAVEEQVGVRRIPTDDRIRLFETYELGDDLGTVEAASRGTTRDVTGWSVSSGSKHILMSGCRADQLSKELAIEGRTRGVFSYSLLTTLAAASGTLTYRDLHKRVEALVASKVSGQTPQFESADAELLRQPFLGGDVVTETSFFTMRHDRDRGWLIDGGAVHGVAGPSGDETTALAIFPADGSPDLRDLSASVGTASVTAVDAHASRVEPTLTGGEAPDPGLTYRAVVVSTPLPPVGVVVEGEETGTQLVRAKLPTPVVAEAPAGTAELRLTAEGGWYRIARAGDERALGVDIPEGYTEATAQTAVQRLEHIGRWIRALQLANPTSQLPPNAVTISIYRQDPATSGDAVPDVAASGEEIVLNYERTGATWEPPRIWIRLQNVSDRRLWCALFDLTAQYGIDAALLRGEWLDPGKEVWALARKPVVASIPDDLWRNDKVIDYRDTLKLVASTEQFDASLLEQPSLEDAGPRTATRGRAIGSTLDRLMARVQTRVLGAGSEAGEALADWITSALTITTVRPLEAQAISGATAVDVDGVAIAEHPSLVASARLSSVPVASRSLDALVLPRLLRDDPGRVQPLAFTASRGGEPGLSVLELVDVRNPEAVTPEQPLRVRTGLQLGKDEHVLAVGFDGEFFLPLGHGAAVDTGTEIVIDRLPPEPTPADLERPEVRSLGGSIRIFFHKVAGTVLGVGYEYPILAATDIADDGEVAYTQEKVRERVEAASRIMVLIHGIIGDTRGMAEQAHAINRADAAEFAQPLARHYDLILTFDYENLNTPIEETAKQLRERLEAVGLTEGHGKEVDIVAHSMGGLVSRWLIEREGGAPLVQQLVMLGTPNGGSPWPTVQKWATVAIGLGLNAMTAVVWPVKVLGWLVQAVERVDAALDQMEPNCEFLRKLAESENPGVPYTVVAGNTSIFEAAVSGGKLERLLDRLDPVRTAADLAFFSQPNDIAVSVKSVQSVPAGWDPAVQIPEPVACDHSTYLVTEAGRAAFIQALP